MSDRPDVAFGVCCWIPRRRCKIFSKENIAKFLTSDCLRIVHARNSLLVTNNLYILQICVNLNIELVGKFRLLTADLFCYILYVVRLIGFEENYLLRTFSKYCLTNIFSS